jgi:hypothetical protein
MTRGVLLALVLALAGGGVTACGGNAEVERAEARAIAAIDADRLPAELLGLQIKREDIAEILDSTKRPYLDEAGLYSLREGETLQATLQVGRFAEGVDHTRPEFRQKLLNTVGGGSIRELRLGDRQVYLTSGDRQQVALWFQDAYLMVLSTREEYGTPRALLRAALELQP